MDCTMEERAQRIIAACLQTASRDPLEIFEQTARQDFVRMHGPEHHILDGACLLTAYSNAGGRIELEPALRQLMAEGLRMPGAMCGLWGVCGAVSSVGAALVIIEQTGPLTADGSWESHMEYTSSALKALSQIGGPRCCKRDGFTALLTAADYVSRRYRIQLTVHPVTCSFYPQNAQCLGSKCPYHP